jgi:hypothetical protein
MSHYYEKSENERCNVEECPPELFVVSFSGGSHTKEEKSYRDGSGEELKREIYKF